MEKISINLLPIELRDSSKKNTKQTLLTKISVGVLVLVIVISLAVLSWTVVIKSSLQKANNELASVTQQIQAQKDKEGLVFLLKSRLDLVSKLLQKESPQTQSFNLITSLMPTDVKMLNFSVDKSGSIRISAFTTSLQGMQTLFNSLTDPKQNEGKIISAKVDSLSKNQDGNYSFELILSYATK